jgi:hypothetical protein
MSTINSKNVQVGTSGTANQNFTLYQPASPDGTVRLGVGNSGATTSDVVTVTNAGDVTVGNNLAVTALIKVNTIQDASGGNNAQLLGVASPPNSMGFRNRLINGGMVIDQRNAGASVAITTSSNYTVDRWRGIASQDGKYTVQQNSGSITPPAGFSNYLGAVSLSSFSGNNTDVFCLNQGIEGFNVADLGWGAAGAQSITLSFWVRSSLTGTFGGALRNAAAARSYPFAYTITAANTWEFKTIPIAGDTTGTWLTNNGVGIGVNFGLGVGSTLSGTAGAWASASLLSATGATSVIATNGATFYITGVQLEAGTVASPFERRDYGRELMMCQRYCVLLGGEDGESHVGAGTWYATTAAIYQMRLPVKMRASPTLTNVSPTVTMYTNGSALTGTAPTINTASQSSVEFYTPVSSGSTTAGFGTSARYTAGSSLLTSEL